MTGIRTVTVFGAGIAGLTAAQELAERGFAVQVVEAATHITPAGRREIAVGGLARTQYGLVPLPVPRADLEAAARGERAPVATVSLSQPHRWGDSAAELDDAVEALRGEYAGFVAVASDPEVRAALLARGLPEDRVEVEQAPASSVRLRAAVVHGEHGFRFFPAFYRHLHDSLRRIPSGSGSVFDRLVAPGDQAIAAQGRPARVLPRGADPSGDAFQRALDALTEAVGVTPRDVVLSCLRMLRYATTGRARRQAVCEQLNSFDYLTLLDPGGFVDGDARLDLSPAQEAFLRHCPRTLVAMDGEQGDARTACSVWLQLMLPPPDGAPVDAMLDGPTSEAMLEPWRAHLEALGVRFFSGRLRPMESAEGPFEVDPVLPGGLAGYEPSTDYAVVALDLLAAERTTRRLPGEFFDRLRSFAHDVPTEPGGSELAPRDPEAACGQLAWDRLQTLTGVQFGLGTRSELARTYLYVADSPWALSSIAQSAWWRRAPSLGADGHLTWISVDIGEARVAGSAGASLWELDADGVAREAWAQLCAGLSTQRLAEPLWYHLDRWLVFGESGLERNEAPFLVNPAGDWARRPGPEAGHTELHAGRLAFAGTWLRTHTRMTTMEAANESARHAVNAILRHVDVELGGPGVEPPRPASGRAEPRIPQSTAVGDLCGVWDPEEHEVEGLRFLKELDDLLFARGLPHVATILRLEQLPDGFDEQSDPVVAVAEHLRATVERELALRPELGGELGVLLRLLRGAGSGHVAPNAAAAGGPDESAAGAEGEAEPAP